MMVIEADKATDLGSDSPQARAERLRYIREEVLRVSRAELQTMTKVKESSIQNWEYARYNGLSERGAKRLEAAFQKLGMIQCTAKWLLYGIGQRPGVSLMHYAQQNLDAVLEKSQEDIIAEELRLFHRLNKNAIDCIVQDSNMQPLLRPQDIVAGIQVFGNDIDTIIGEVCIVKALAGQVSVRQLEKGTQAGHYTLSCYYPTPTLTEQDIKLFSAAPVLWLRRQLKRS